MTLLALPSRTQTSREIRQTVLLTGGVVLAAIILATIWGWNRLGTTPAPQQSTQLVPAGIFPPAAGPAEAMGSVARPNNNGAYSMAVPPITSFDLEDAYIHATNAETTSLQMSEHLSAAQVDLRQLDDLFNAYYARIGRRRTDLALAHLAEAQRLLARQMDEIAQLNRIISKGR